MSKWRKGRDVIKLLDIEDFELVKYISNGLTPFDKYGRPIPENDFCVGPGESYAPEEIEALIQDEMKRERRRQRPSAVGSAGGNPTRADFPHLRPPSEERELRKIAENNIRALPYFPNKPERSWRHFDLPTSSKDAERVIHEMLDWRFWRDDVLKFMPEGNAETEERKPAESMKRASADPVVKAGLEFFSNNPDARLEDIAYSDEVTRCFKPDKMPELSTIMKRLQGKIPVKKGRRKKS